MYYGAPFAQRQQVHACLAAAAGPDEPDQRAWHLAHSVTGPDEKVAAELERAGERACRRGGWSEAAANGSGAPGGRGTLASPCCWPTSC